MITWVPGVVLVPHLPLLPTARVPLRVVEVALFVTGSVIVFVGLAELLLGSLVWAASAGLTWVGFSRQVAAGHDTGALNLVLPRLHVMLWVLLVLVWVLTGMREHYHRALAHADLLAAQALTDP